MCWTRPQNPPWFISFFLRVFFFFFISTNLAWILFLSLFLLPILSSTFLRVYYISLLSLLFSGSPRKKCFSIKTKVLQIYRAHSVAKVVWEELLSFAALCTLLWLRDVKVGLFLSCSNVVLDIGAWIRVFSVDWACLLSAIVREKRMKQTQSYTGPTL